MINTYEYKGRNVVCIYSYFWARRYDEIIVIEKRVYPNGLTGDREMLTWYSVPGSDEVVAEESFEFLKKIPDYHE